VQRLAIARGSLRVVNDAERPRDYVRRDVLHESKKGGGVYERDGTGARERNEGWEEDEISVLRLT